MEQGTALLFAVVVILPITVYAESYVFSSPPKCGTGWAFNAPRSRATVRSKQECDEICSKMNNCKSYQIRQSPKVKCQLLKRTAGKWAKRMTPKAGWAYREQFDPKSESCKKFPYHTCSPTIKSFWNYTQYSFWNYTQYGFWNYTQYSFSNYTQYSFSNYTQYSLGGYYGAYMRDTILDDEKRYYIAGYGNERWLYEYGDYESFLKDQQTKYYMPFGCHGAEAIVRNRTLWCKEYDNRNVVVYNIDQQAIIGKINFDSVKNEDGTEFNAGYSDHCAYDIGVKTDIDVMSDYGGAVTIVWGRLNYNCWLAASEIDPDTLEIMETHWLDFKKNELGTGFQTCGRLYFTATAHGDPATMFELIWDLRTMNYTHLSTLEHRSAGYMLYPNRHNYNTMADFNPRLEVIDKWNNARCVSMNVEFEPQPADLWEGSFPPYSYSLNMKTKP